MKKALSLMLVGAMTIGLLSGCGKTETPAATTTAPAASTSTTTTSTDTKKAEPVTLKMWFEGSNVTDDTAVLEAANAYLEEKLNVRLEPIWGTWGDFDTNVVLALQGGDDVDIVFTCSWTANEFNTYAKSGFYKRLDDPADNLMEKYGQEFWAMLPQPLKDGSTIDGAQGYGVYAVNGNKDFGAQYCWDVNYDKLTDLGYTLDDVKRLGYYGFEEIFAAAKAKYGADFYPLLPEGGNTASMATSGFGIAGDDSDVISYYINYDDPSKEGKYGLTYVSRFETEDYAKYVKQAKAYYDAGYVDPQLSNESNATEYRENLRSTGNYLIGVQSYSLGYEAQASEERGITVKYVGTCDAFCNTIASQGAMMAITQVSKHPAEAMQFLNLLNTDKYLFQLLDYGVEGVHYNYNAEGEVEFTEKRADYTPWTNGMGNVNLLTGQKGQGADFYTTTFGPYYASAKSLPDLGFIFDGESVGDQIGACKDAKAGYQAALEFGYAPEGTLEEMIAKLKACGVDDIVAEANKQLEAWKVASGYTAK